MNLPPPFDTFRLEMHPGDHKDFGISADDPYPLKGVTYPTEYGEIAGYTGEDGDLLDLFVGTGALLGFIKVSRPDVEHEHKFYVNLTEDEEAAVLGEFDPVILSHGRFESIEQLIKAIEPFKD